MSEIRNAYADDWKDRGTCSFVVAAAHVSPEIVEYPDSGKLASMSRGESQRGDPLRTVHRLDDVVDYFDGEDPKT